MALDDLQGVIEKLQKTIEAHRRYLAENETRTRQVLIDPLLRELGWDVSDPDTIELEYWVRQKRADYALISNRQPVAVIEAKRLGNDLEDDEMMQVLNYANLAGIDYMIATDGDRWEMYEVFKRGALEERLLMKFRLSEQPAHKNALQALAMWKPNLTSDSTPSAATESVFVSPKVAPDQTDVKSNEQQREQLSNEVSADTEKPYSFASERRYPRYTTPTRLEIGDNIKKQVTFWLDVIHEVAVWLVDEGMLSDNDCPILIGKKVRRTFIDREGKVNPDGTPFKNPQQLPNGLILQRSQTDTWEQWDRLTKLLEQFDVDPSTIRVFYRSTGRTNR